MKSDRIKATSAALVKARLELTPLDGFPTELPDNLDMAYAVQAQSIADWPDEVVGWKVGGVPPHLQDEFNAKRMAGPIFKKSVKHCADGETIDMGSYPGGFVAVEAEYIVFLKNVSDLPQRDITLNDMPAVVDRMHIGVEIASSPMKLVNALGPLSIVSDFGNNAGMIVGKEVPDPLGANLTKYVVSVDFNDEQIGAKPTGEGEGGPFGAVIFLINHLRSHGLKIPDGTAVSTGAISGVHDTEIGVHSKVDFGELGSMNINLVPFAD